MIEALRHSFGELKLPSSQTLLTRNVPLVKGTICLSLGKPVCSPLYLKAVFNLTSFIVYLFSSLSSSFFHRVKEPKRPAHGLSKSLSPRLGNSANIPRLSLSCRLCLPFQSREQKNSLHALPASYGTHAQTLLFLFLNWN